MKTIVLSNGHPMPIAAEFDGGKRVIVLLGEGEFAMADLSTKDGEVPAYDYSKEAAREGEELTTLVRLKMEAEAAKVSPEAAG